MKEPGSEANSNVGLTEIRTHDLQHYYSHLQKAIWLIYIMPAQYRRRGYQ